MQKTFMLMMRVIYTAATQTVVPDENSEETLSLDFRKAYGTVSRDYLFLVLTRFGISPAFVTMIRDLHVGTDGPTTCERGADEATSGGFRYSPSVPASSITFHHICRGSCAIMICRL